jgi:hypothetical protein
MHNTFPDHRQQLGCSCIDKPPPRHTSLYQRKKLPATSSGPHPKSDPYDMRACKEWSTLQHPSCGPLRQRDCARQEPRPSLVCQWLGHLQPKKAKMPTRTIRTQCARKEACCACRDADNRALGSPVPQRERARNARPLLSAHCRGRQ